MSQSTCTRVCKKMAVQWMTLFNGFLFEALHRLFIHLPFFMCPPFFHPPAFFHVGHLFHPPASSHVGHLFHPPALLMCPPLPAFISRRRGLLIVHMYNCIMLMACGNCVSVQFTILIRAFSFSTDRNNCRRSQEAVVGATGEL